MQRESEVVVEQEREGERSTCAYPGSWGRTEPVAVEKGVGWSCVLSTVRTF